MTSINKIQARKVIQNNQEFLLGTFKIKQVREFTKFTQHIVVDYEEIEQDAIVGVKQIKPIYQKEVQRKINSSKVERIADFLINDPTAMFPTNIVISIPSIVIDDFEEDEKRNVVLTLNDIVYKEIRKDDGDIFLTIIDGQHRIKGIERAVERLEQDILDLERTLRTVPENKELERKKLKSKELLDRLLEFELLVTFFIDPTLEFQAMIFATINKTQTKVPENLVYSLFGLTKDDSPQKTALEVVLALNGIEKSPFFNRVKLVGGNYRKGESVPLSQATMVKSILYLISNNQRESETDRFKKRTELLNNPRNLPFRKFYAKDNDNMIIRIMYSFFSVVRDIFTSEAGESYWEINGGKISNILHTNVGYQALLKILCDILKVIPEEKMDKREVYESYLIKAKDINWEDAGDEKRYPFTSSSIKTLYDDIRAKVFQE